MATLRNNRKLAAVSRETPEITRNNQSQNTPNAGMAEEYITQVSEKMEARITKKLFQEISRTESRILCALSKHDEFFLSLQFRTCSVAVRATSRNNNSENQEPTADPSLTDPCPEVIPSACHTSNLNDSEQGETHYMVTRVQEEIPYQSPATSSRKQKKARSTSKPQFGSWNTPATIEANQIFLARQQLATNCNSANFNKNQNLENAQIPQNENAHF